MESDELEADLFSAFFHSFLSLVKSRDCGHHVLGKKKLAHKHTSLFSGLAQTLTTQLSSNSDLECAQACLHLHVSPVSRTADQTRRDIITTGREAGSTEVCVSRGGLLHIR